MSEEWRNYLGNLPVAPDPPVPVRTVYDIVRRYDPAMPDKNIRSQLNAYKIKGIVELVNGGWRLTRPLQASGEIQSENEAGDGDVTVISDDETPPAEPSGVSGASSPLLSFQTRAAA